LADRHSTTARYLFFYKKEKKKQFVNTNNQQPRITEKAQKVKRTKRSTQ